MAGFSTPEDIEQEEDGLGGHDDEVGEYNVNIDEGLEINSAELEDGENKGWEDDECRHLQDDGNTGSEAGSESREGDGENGSTQSSSSSVSSRRTYLVYSGLALLMLGFSCSIIGIMHRNSSRYSSPATTQPITASPEVATSIVEGRVAPTVAPTKIPTAVVELPPFSLSFVGAGSAGKDDYGPAYEVVTDHIDQVFARAFTNTDRDLNVVRDRAQYISATIQSGVTAGEVPAPDGGFVELVFTVILTFADLPGLIIPSVIELETVLEDTFQGDNLRLVLDVLESTLLPSNIFSNTTNIIVIYPLIVPESTLNQSSIPSSTPVFMSTFSPSTLVSILAPSTVAPTLTPSTAATMTPTLTPSAFPPTLSPSAVIPTLTPSTTTPTMTPTVSPPTTKPTLSPSAVPTIPPAMKATMSPSAVPTVPPTMTATIPSPTFTPTALSHSSAPTTAVSSGRVALFGLLFEIDRASVPPAQGYDEAGVLMAQHINVYFEKEYTGTDRLNAFGDSSQYVAGDIASGFTAYSLLSGALIDFTAELSFTNGPGLVIPSTEQLNLALQNAFEGDNLQSALDLLAKALPSSNLFSTTTNIRVVESMKATISPSTTPQTMTPIVTPTAISLGKLTPFGLLFDIARASVPSAQDYDEAGVLMAHHINAYFEKGYTGTEGLNIFDDPSQFVAGDIASGDTAYSLASGAVMDFTAELSFAMVPGLAIPSTEQLNRALEDAYRGANLQSALELLATALPPANLFSTATSIRVVGNSKLVRTQIPTFEPTIEPTVAATTASRFVEILPFSLSYNIDQVSIPIVGDYQEAAALTVQHIDSHFARVYTGSSVAQYVGASIQTGGTSYSLVDGPIIDFTADMAFADAPGLGLPPAEELDLALEAAFQGDNLQTFLDLLVRDLPSYNQFSTASAIQVSRPNAVLPGT